MKRLDKRTLYTLEDYLEGTGPDEWRTVNNGIILIKHMDNGHLQNAIHLVKRTGLTDHSKYTELLREAQRRGWGFNPDKEEFFLGGAL